MNRSLASFVFTGETLFHIKGPVAAKEAKTPAAAPPKKIPAAGTLVLVDFLPDTDREFLTKIMASAGVVSADMEIIVQQQFPEYDLLALQQVTRVITFGDFAKVLQLAGKPVKYSPETHDGKKILIADTLTAIGRNLTNEKRNLWNALKEMFGLS